MKSSQIIALALVLGASAPATRAQTALTDQARVEAKRAELEKIQKDLADPDPLRRQAVIETILESHNASVIDFGLRVALGSEDAALRAVALRAYMANLKELHFEVQAPPDVQRQVEAALNGDQARIADLINRYPYLRKISDFSWQVLFKLKNYDMFHNTGVASMNNPEHETTFTVTGDHVSGTGFAFWIVPCRFDFQPQKLVKDGLPVLKGTLVCNDGSPRLTIIAPMF